MKKIIHCFFIMLVSVPSYGQSWSNMLRSSKPVKYEEVIKAFEKENVEKTSQPLPKTKADTREFEKKNHLFYKWENFNKTRLDGDGHVTNTSWRTMQAAVEQQNYVTAENLLPHGNWQSIGPTDNNSSLVNPADVGHGIGRVNCITFNGSQIFLGTASGGAWKGTGSNTWQSISENIPNLSVSSICINHLNPDVIYILTGDGDGYWCGPSNPSIGVIKSTDGGISWQPTGLVWTDDGSEEIGYKMVMHPVNPETLYVASSTGIHMTLDGGATWSVQPGFFTDIEFKPGNPSYMYAVTLTNFFLTTTGGIGGWTQQAQPVVLQPSSRLAIAVSPNKPNWVYVLAGSKGQPFFVGLWLSTNSGVSFGAPKSSVNPFIFSDNSNTYSQAQYNIAFTANPANAKEIWMGAIKVFSSSDSGTTWTQRSSYYSLSNDILHPDQHDLVYSPAGELWCANDGGIFKYTPANALTKWSIQFEGLNITQFYRFGLDATPPFDNNYFGAQDNGMLRYDGDANFETVASADGGEAAVDYISDIYYFNLNSLLLKSSCIIAACDITPNTAACNCPDTVYNKNVGVQPNRPIKIDPVNNNWVYHGLQCLWVSASYGDNFNVIQGFDCTGGMINDVDITPVSKWAIKDHRVLRETAPGVWINVTNDLLLNTEINVRIAAHTTNPLEAYVCCGGYNSTQKVFYTTDGGVNWYNLSAGLPNTPINDIIYQNGSDGGYYAATDIGVYYINNNMFFWMPFRNGMPSVVVTELDINYSQNKLYASTYGRGAWVSDLITPCPPTDLTSLYPSLPSYSNIQANNTVTANSQFNHGFGQNVTLLSGYEVNFTPGFEASNGTEITARIQNCPALKQATSQEFSGNYIPASKPVSETGTRTLNESQINISPNPAFEMCAIDISLAEKSDLEIEVLNLLGEKIMDVTMQSGLLPGNYRFMVNVGKFESGIYLVKAVYENQIKTEKVVVKK